MALMTATKACPWVLVGGAGGVLAVVGSWDSGVIVAAVGGVGMAVLGLIFEYRRRRFEADKLEAQARIEAIQLEAVAKAAALKVEATAKIERERIILDAQIANDKLREEKYSGTLTEQLRVITEQNAKLQRSLDEGNARVEEANRKLHSLRNEAQTAAATFYEERLSLTKQLDDLRHDYAELLLRMEAKIKDNTRKSVVHDDQIAELQQIASSDAIPALGNGSRVAATDANTAAIRENSAAVASNTAAIEEVKPGSGEHAAQ